MTLKLFSTRSLFFLKGYSPCRFDVFFWYLIHNVIISSAKLDYVVRKIIIYCTSFLDLNPHKKQMPKKSICRVCIVLKKIVNRILKIFKHTYRPDPKTSFKFEKLGSKPSFWNLFLVCAP